MIKTKTDIQLHEVLEVISITPNTYILKLEKKNFSFIPGQYIILGDSLGIHRREYSIFSSINDPFLSVLIKEVEDGDVSVKLKRSDPGDKLSIEGPFGTFYPKYESIYNTHHLFIATGTGISPFHSVIQSYPKLNYTLIHGVSSINEAYMRQSFDASKIIICTSKTNEGNFNGRVTQFLKNYTLPSQTTAYLCGNGNMIFDVFDILTEKGLKKEFIKTEIYF